MKLTNSVEDSGNWLVVLLTDNLVLAEDVSTDTLQNTELSSTLVGELTEGEWESSELLVDLTENLTGRWTLESECVGGLLMYRWAVWKSLDLWVC